MQHQSRPNWFFWLRGKTEKDGNLISQEDHRVQAPMACGLYLLAWSGYVWLVLPSTSSPACSIIPQCFSSDGGPAGTGRYLALGPLLQKKAWLSHLFQITFEVLTTSNITQMSSLFTSDGRLLYIFCTSSLLIAMCLHTTKKEPWEDQGSKWKKNKIFCLAYICFQQTVLVIVLQQRVMLLISICLLAVSTAAVAAHIYGSIWQSNATGPTSC